MSQEDTIQFLSINEDGYLFQNDTQIIDNDLGASVFASLSILPNNSFGAYFRQSPVIIEAFDSPLIVKSIQRRQDDKRPLAKNELLQLNFNYNYSLVVEVKNFFLDSWDRLHGELNNQVPFTFSRKAQEQFFEMLEEYSDDDFLWAGRREKFYPFWSSDNSALSSPDWWNQVYEGEENPSWNLGAPAETLKDMLPRLKLPKSKILVLGCGNSHDVAYFADHGHLVTAIDISPYAIEKSKKLFGHIENIQWIEADLFNLPSHFYGQFDIVYEYTCFCAIDPSRRNELIKIWRQCLHDQGQLMGTFFCMHKRNGPPFGGTEWELRERLKNKFQFLFWGRWRTSIPRRQGRELFILAKKK